MLTPDTPWSAKTSSNLETRCLSLGPLVGEGLVGGCSLGHTGWFGLLAHVSLLLL